MLDWVEGAVDECLHRIGQFVDAFAAGEHPHYIPITLPDANVVPFRKRRSPRKIQATLSGLLDNVEEAFESASLPMSSGARLPEDTARALRKMGPWVPFGSPWEESMNAADDQFMDCVGDVARLPGMFCMSRGYKVDDVDGLDVRENGIIARYATIAFAAGTKLEKAPWYVEQVPGTHYHFWMGFRNRKKVEWVSCEMAISPEGKVRAVSELVQMPVLLPNGDRYYRKEWKIPLVDGSKTWNPVRDTRKKIAVDIFVRVVGWWLRREERWIVTVKRNMRRVTFSVDHELTKDFFADRDKTVLNEAGTPKKIIHFVREHTRTLANGRVVPVIDHIRGLREFDWRGYHCIITAPKYHTFNLGKWTLSALDEDDLPKSGQYYSESRVAGLLASYEESDQRVLRGSKRRRAR